MRFNNYLLNYSEKGYEELASAGLSADYVYRETKRALAGVQGKGRIIPGIDVGIPTSASGRKASRRTPTKQPWQPGGQVQTVSSCRASTPR